ncbi:MAG: hypothetical protein ABIZ07_06285, partial [Dermatophilaceae bacterium]
PRPEVSLAGTFTWSNPLTGNMANGSCPTSWIDLLYWLRVARTLDGDQPDRFYYALLPSGVPTGDTGGCGNPGGVGAGFVGGNGGTTIAHELGHVLGFAHVFGNLPSDDNKWDRSYPVYEPYDSAAARTGTIGEYGFDLTTSTVMSPTWSTDFMGYGANPWISPYHHRLMIEHPRLSPVWVPLPRGTLAPLDDEQVLTWPPVFPGPPEPPWGKWTEHVRPDERESLFVVSGRLVGGEVQMQHVLHLEAFTGIEGRVVPDLTVELLGPNREVLSQGKVHLLPTSACSDGCGGCAGGSDADADSIVQAKVRDPGGEVEGSVSAIRVVKLGEEVWRREAPSRPPEVRGVEAGFDGEQLFIRWDANAADDAAQVDRFVRWSGDDGRTWQVLAVGVDTDELTTSPAAMTSGPALVQVMVSDGFHTVISEPVRVEVPWRAPSVAILWPRSTAAITTSSPLRLWGVATASTGEALDGERVTWEVDGERVAVGADQFAWLSLSPGEHRAVVRADDGQGEGSAEVVFTVHDPSD